MVDEDVTGAARGAGARTGDTPAPRRRRAASRPAGPPAGPDSSAPPEAAAPDESAPSAEDAVAPAKTARTRKRAAKKAPASAAAEPVAAPAAPSEPAPAAPVAAGEATPPAPAAAGEPAGAPAKRSRKAAASGEAAKTAPAKRTSKRAAKKLPPEETPAPETSAPEAPASEMPASEMPAPETLGATETADVPVAETPPTPGEKPKRTRRSSKKATAPTAAPVAPLGTPVEADQPVSVAEVAAPEELRDEEEQEAPAATAAFVAPTVLFQPPDPEAAPRRRTRKRAAAALEPTPDPVTPVVTRGNVPAPSEASTPTDAGEPASPDDDVERSATDDDDGDRARDRPRRRRGGRGRRGRSRGEGEGGGDSTDSTDGTAGTDSTDGGSENREAHDAARAAGDDTDAPRSERAPAEATDAEDAADSDEADGEGGSRRRRRRRRRGGGGDEGELAPDDPPNTVVRVRETRSRSRKADKADKAEDADEVQSVRGSTRLEAKKQRRREGRDQGRRRPPLITESEFLARRESVERLMLVRQTGDRTQIAVLEDDILVEHYVNRASSSSFVGNVYLGKVQNVLPSMEAAFLDIGKGRNGVLYAGEVNWDAAGMEGQPKRIELALKSGDSVLVQVTKDPLGQKGARLTSQVSLPGRYLVYVPDGSMTGISRKLPDTERTRLKAVLKKVLPEEAGVIVRTAAEGASEEELNLDVSRLSAQWEDIAKLAKSASAPALLHGEPDMTVRVIRDIFNEDFTRMIVSGNDAWGEIQTYVGQVAPDLGDRLSRWTEENDIFGAYRIDEQLAKALDRKVYLPSGGSLVIDRTEAMVVVDVNTGKFIGKGGNLEETVTKNNVEAAEEIVRQLRLRDLGGIIVIDFIDMVLESNRELVMRRLLECLGRDRTKHQVAEVTSLGLVQMTRKRVGQGLLEVFSETCEHCNGRGVKVSMDPVESQPFRDGDDRDDRSQASVSPARGRKEIAAIAGATRAGNGQVKQADPVAVEDPVEPAVNADAEEPTVRRAATRRTRRGAKAPAGPPPTTPADAALPEPDGIGAEAAASAAGRAVERDGTTSVAAALEPDVEPAAEAAPKRLRRARKRVVAEAGPPRPVDVS